MAYNNYFPTGYQYFAPQYGYQPQNSLNNEGFQNVQPNNQTQQNMGFIRVQNENEARMYPVTAGTSVTFINENEPYCYTKSVDLSQLDRPKFEKYRLVKEEPNEPIKEKPLNMEMYALKDDVAKEIQRLEDMIKESCSA